MKISHASKLPGFSTHGWKTHLLFHALACLMLAACFVAMHAQQTNVGMTGTVRDPAGQVVVGATVAARNLTTGVATETTTDGKGVYLLTSATLQIGDYSLTVTSPGFETWISPDVRLITGQILTYDATLTIGTVAQQVVVSSTAVHLDTTTAVTGITMTTDEIKDLPLELGGTPRSSLAFLSTMSSVSSGGNATSVALGSYGGSSIMGTGGNGNTNNNPGYTIDGMSASNRYWKTIGETYPVVPDAIQELRLASDFNAEQGWNNGVEVSLITKSGTNHVHGSVYEYFGNTVLDAKNWFAKAASAQRQNEFGFTLGGPIRRDKTFFYGALDFYRYTNTAAGVVGTVPTTLMQSGNFSQLLGAQIGTDALGRPIYSGEIYDPTTTTTLPNGAIVRNPFDCNGVLNAICPSEFSKVSAFLAAGYPAPTLSGTQNNWVGLATPAPLEADKIFVRVDHQFDEGKQTLMLGLDGAPVYNPSLGVVNLGPLLTTQQNEPYKFYRARIGYTWSIKPSMVYSLYLTGDYTGSTYNSGTGPSATAGKAAGLTGVVTPGLPLVSISQTTGFGSTYYSYSNPIYGFPNAGTNFTWIIGKHSLKFGGEYIQDTVLVDPQATYTSGQFSFSPLETDLPSYTATGYGYASFLLGQVNSAMLNNEFNVHFAGAGFGVYAQDQWRLTPKLTVNYGLRWDGVKPPWEHDNLFGAFSPTVPNPAAGNLLGNIQFWGTSRPGAIGLHYIVDPNYKLFDPRLGIAYAVTDKMVIRASYGIVDAPNFSAFNGGTTAPTYGAEASITPVSTNNGVTAAFDWDGGFLGTAVASTNPTFENGNSVEEIIPQSNEVGRTQAFGVGIEQTLPWGLTSKIEYLGKLTHGLLWTYALPYPSIDQLPLKYLSLGTVLQDSITSPQAVAAGITAPYVGFTGSVAQALTPYPQYTSVIPYNSPSSFTEYNAGHFALQKRFAQNGLSFLIDYTWSKMFMANLFQEGMYAQQAKQLAPSDEPQNVALSYDYELPFGKDKRLLGATSSFVQQVVGGWSIAGIQNYQSGTPIIVTTQATIPSVSNVWAIRNPGVPVQSGTSCKATVPGSAARYLNIGAFSTPPAFTLGNTYTQSSARSCKSASENISVTKNFYVREGINFKFGAEFFNLLNRHTFTGLGLNINSASTFGTFSSASTPRLIQFNARIVF